MQTQIGHALSRIFEISGFNPVLDPAGITVKPCYAQYQNHHDSHYTCPIAFSLAHQLGRSPLAVAQILAESIGELVGDRFQVAVAGDGWLNFGLCDRFMAESLSTLSQLLESRSVSCTVSRSRSTSNFPGFSYVQYAYARCCALLRLARQQELRDRQTFSWQLLDPTGDLYLRTAIEQRLILCLLTIADQIVRNFNHPQAQNHHVVPKLSQKLSKNLAADFLNFYDTCRILSADRQVAMARIGLIITVKEAIAHLVADQIFLPESL